MRKQMEADQRFFDKRNRFAEKHKDRPMWFVADNWPLFAGDINIGRFLAIADLVRSVIDLPGHFCELGCFNGTNLLFLAKLLRLWKPYSYAEVFGFDSFEGLRTFDSKGDLPPGEMEGTYRGSEELLEDAIEMHGLGDGLVRLIKGDVRQTLPVFLEQRKDIRFSFIYLDMDLYDPTKHAIELLYPRLLKGGIMVFDEYNTEGWPGETTAVHDVLGQDVTLLSPPNARQPVAYVVK